MPAVFRSGQRKGEDDPAGTSGRTSSAIVGEVPAEGIPRNVPGHASLGLLKPCRRTPWGYGFHARGWSILRQKSARRMKGLVSSGPPQRPHSAAQTAEDPTPGQTGGTTLAGAAETGG